MLLHMSRPMTTQMRCCWTVTQKLIFLPTIITLFLVTAVAAGVEQNVVVAINGMTCEVCAVAVKKSLKSVSGVKSVRVSFEEKKARLGLDSSVTDECLAKAVRNADGTRGRLSRESSRGI